MLLAFSHLNYNVLYDIIKDIKNKKINTGNPVWCLRLCFNCFPPFDFLWAAVSACLMTKLYRDRKGKIAAVISFLEEALPIPDITNKFTFVWLYTLFFPRKRGILIPVLMLVSSSKYCLHLWEIK